ncbi:MAG: glycosyltransferase family 4 protein [Bacteroidota bacterium]
MKKVIHFIRKKSHLKASFIQNQIVNHINYEPYVVFRQKQKNNIIDGGFARDLGKNIEILNLGEKESFFERIIFRYLKRLSKKQKTNLHQKIKEIQPNILHFHYGTDAGIYLKTLKNFHIPKVVSFYGYECSGFPKRFWGFGKKYLQTRVYRYADKIFAMSPDMKKDIIATGCPEDKIIIHYHGSNVNHFKQNHEYQKKGHINFLIISGFVPQKGHIFLLRAFAKAYKKNPDIRLTIVGAGELESKIKQTIQELNLEDIVKMPGPVIYGSEEHKNYFKTHDVFIHPSLTDINGDKEGIPGAIIEAMAAGLPVISTYHAGIPYVIENKKAGLLVQEWDIEQLSESILSLANSNALRQNYGQEAQKYALAHLDLYKKEQELEDIYRMLEKK